MKRKNWQASLFTGLAFTALLPVAALGADPLTLNLSGVVEPRERVAIANQITGVVSRVLVVAGQHVERGDALFELDSEPFKIDVATAKAELNEARARLRLAEDVAARQGRLAERGSGAEARATQSEIEVEVARAVVARQESALARAELALERTRIVAPISGTVGKTKVAPGAFVEAEGGTVLGEIVQIDPILVGYRVPYEDRQRSLDKAQTKTARALFDNVTLTLVLPNGSTYAHRGKPKFESAEIDRETGDLTTWAEFPNPDGVLVPGLNVKVISEIAAASTASGEQK
ncbi:efflux RND transporter periplasmic adaptor subunit [Hyphomicrobium sp.]|uniref:efflux RND transporter periplasmic adaptor subunit n=1 Tax=Hyphomicrobium sp. TaxID=82 RepID=UPI002E3412E4|nr:efflux RND transporter periplasmic adaptor subunit [Hyphomicrobium sp.]HEX2840472.1 efflux RND transporter periplasmic adaptor subunit [Hyphomicrobium sp.]